MCSILILDIDNITWFFGTPKYYKNSGTIAATSRKEYY